MADPTAGADSGFWQGLAALGTVLSGLVLGLFAAKRRKPADDGDEPTRDSREREADLRDQLREERFERKMEQTLAAHRLAIENAFTDFRRSVYKKMDELTEERRKQIREIEDRVLKVERDRP